MTTDPIPTCHAFEARLEALAAPAGESSLRALPTAERAACLRHAESCPACRELLELARMATEPEPGGPTAGLGGEALVAAVMAETSGPACDRALEPLAVWGPPGDASTDELLTLHLEGCAECRAHAAVLRALATDLPRLASDLAEERPDPGFVDDVLAATLPLPVRLRRWWSATGERVLPRAWGRWVRRPRFALEAAFVVTVAFLPLIVASGPDLAAAPARGAEELARIAREAGRTDFDRLLEAETGDRLGSRFDGTLREIGGSEPVQRAGRGLGAAKDAVGAGLAEGYGTLRDLAASFFTTEGEDTAPPETRDDPPATERPASEETKR